MNDLHLHTLDDDELYRYALHVETPSLLVHELTQRLGAFIDERDMWAIDESELHVAMDQAKKTIAYLESVVARLEAARGDNA